MTDEPAVVDVTAVEEPDQPPSAEVVPYHPAPGGATALIQAGSPDELVEKASAIATTLDRIVKEKGLSTKIGNKDHVNIEAWQTLATLLGAAPVIRWTRRVIDPQTAAPEVVEYEVAVKDYEWVTENGKRVKRHKADRTYTVKGYNWEACCDVFKDGTLIASAESMVSRTEDRWAQADDYAVRSMAQTRAQSRAIAAAARWVVTLAGYSGTPADEMDGVKPAEQQDRPASAPLEQLSEQGVAQLRRAVALLLGGDEPGPQVQEIIMKLASDAGTQGVPKLAGRAVMHVAAARSAIDKETGFEQPANDEPHPSAEAADRAAAEQGPPAAPSLASGTVPEDDPRAKQVCICPLGIQTPPEKRLDTCPVVNHGIPF